MRRHLIVLAVIPLLSSCGGAVDHPTGKSGVLEGTVFRAPATPTCVKGQPCSRRAPGVTLRFVAGGSVTARVTTRADGTYKVALPIGRYAVSAAAPLRPRSVSIQRGRVRRVDFVLETKIR